MLVPPPRKDGSLKTPPLNDDLNRPLIFQQVRIHKADGPFAYDKIRPAPKTLPRAASATSAWAPE